MTTQIIFLIVSFALTAMLGKIIIPILKKLKVGQSERLDGPRTHLRKQGTPTMGGIIMILSIIVPIILLSFFVNPKFRPALMLLSGASIGFGIVGFIDDYKKSLNRYSAQNGIQSLSTLQGFNSWFNDSVIGAIWNPNSADAFTISFDELTKDLYIINHKEALVYNA